jgi:putative NADH-flavin reductase
VVATASLTSFSTDSIACEPGLASGPFAEEVGTRKEEHVREHHTSRLAIFGATGSLGSHVARLAVAAGHDVSVLVRSPDRLAPDTASKATITTGDLMHQPPSRLGAFISGNDVLISCAGLVTEGQHFVDLFDRIVSSVETLLESRRPLCWLLAGAGLLELDSSGRRGLDLPKVRDTYWPHRVNFERLQRSTIEWRLLCPGPMVDQPAVGIRRLRVSFERLPVAMPTVTKLLPDPLVLPLFATKIPQMIIPYADAAAFMLANLDRGGPMSRKRVGLALPHGMTGHKEVPSAR